MVNEVAGSCILVVDDCPEHLRLLSAILKRGGFVPRPVTNGRLAIEAAGIDPPDLVLLDVCMPEMSGLDVCRKFKQDQRLRNIPIIFISAAEGGTTRSRPSAPVATTMSASHSTSRRCLSGSRLVCG